MKTNYLLPNKYKTIGWVLFCIGILLGMWYFFIDYESDLLTTKVLSLYNYDSMFPENTGFFVISENSVIDELIALSIILGGLFIAFSKEKIEDEFTYKLRTDSLVWAIIFNYTILAFTIIFIYNFTFFDIVVFNMFTPLLFFVFRFNFLKLKSKKDEE